MNESYKVDKHIDVLDGIRAISIMIIVWHHYWQQTWLTPYIIFNNNITKYFGISQSHLHTYVAQAPAFVDLLILLSAVCNLYPYARAIVLGEDWPDTKQFYLKRAVRIFPSYFLCIFIMILVAVFQKEYTDAGFMWKDILTNLTFTNILFVKLHADTKLNGVLWTVQVEVLYYILMPHIAKLFKKNPCATCIALWGISILFSNYITYNKADNIWEWTNYFLNFAGFYANGMLICISYLVIKSKIAENRYIQMFFALSALGCFVGFTHTLESYYEQDIRMVQLTNRFEMVTVYTLFIFAMMLTGAKVQQFFSNVFFKFVSTISYNLYIWHQVIALKCKELRIPHWEGETPPNVLGDVVWQRKYQAVILVITVIVATALTYGFEIPVTKYFRKKLRITK